MSKHGRSWAGNRPAETKPAGFRSHRPMPSSQFPAAVSAIATTRSRNADSPAARVDRLGGLGRRPKADGEDAEVHRRGDPCGDPLDGAQALAAAARSRGSGTCSRTLRRVRGQRCCRGRRRSALTAEPFATEREPVGERSRWPARGGGHDPGAGDRRSRRAGTGKEQCDDDHRGMRALHSIVTGVPTGISLPSVRIAEFLNRMQPCEICPGIRLGRSVPWMPMNPPAGQPVS